MTQLYALQHNYIITASFLTSTLNLKQITGGGQ